MTILESRFVVETAQQILDLAAFELEEKKEIGQIGIRISAIIRRILVEIKLVFIKTIK